MRKATLAVAIGLIVALAGYRADAGTVLDGVKARGQLACGLGNPTTGFMKMDRQGKWTALPSTSVAPSQPPPCVMPTR